MHFSDFYSEENQLCNFTKEQILEIFDLDQIKSLNDNELERQRVYWLSQYMVGNVSEPFEDIKKLDPADQFMAFDTWIDLVKDVDTLKPMIKSILKEFIKGKAV